MADLLSASPCSGRYFGSPPPDRHAVLAGVPATREIAGHEVVEIPGQDHAVAAVAVEDDRTRPHIMLSIAPRPRVKTMSACVMSAVTSS